MKYLPLKDNGFVSVAVGRDVGCVDESLGGRVFTEVSDFASLEVGSFFCGVGLSLSRLEGSVCWAIGFCIGGKGSTFCGFGLVAGFTVDFSVAAVNDVSRFEGGFSTGFLDTGSRDALDGGGDLLGSFSSTGWLAELSFSRGTSFIADPSSLSTSADFSLLTSSFTVGVALLLSTSGLSGSSLLVALFNPFRAFNIDIFNSSSFFSFGVS